MKTFIRSLTLGALTFGLTMMTSQPATAQVVEFVPAWTAAASTCAPDEGAIGKYGFSYGDFFFNGSAVSNTSTLGPIPITVRCNVTNPLDVRGSEPANPNWDALIVGFQDPDGAGTNSRIVARLVRISRPTGAASIVATLNSGGDPLTTRHERFVQFNASALNFANYEYFVEIYLYRASTAVASPRVYSVRLANVDVVE
jgi:hypothetical protein